MDTSQAPARQPDGDPAVAPARLIDFELAAKTAATLSTPGPRLTGAEVQAVVADLRAHAEASVAHVHEISGLEAARDLRDSEVLIVDRASWARANVHSFEAMIDAPLRAAAAKHADKISGAVGEVGSRVTGAEMGAILAFLGSKVLGQYDPFAPLMRPHIPAAGRLLLVAPNIVEVERELGVDPADFRLWVCLHEQTHRVQFAAAPWLRDHLLEAIAELVTGMLSKADSLSDRISQLLSEKTSLSSLLQDDHDKEIMSRLTAVMSLLEGHANVVMDGVDASIVPTVKTIRQRFAARGSDRGPIENWLRKLLGLDAKMRQYADGQRFVSAVVKEVGLEGFNRVWERPEHLPSEHELHHPHEWVERMGA
ncbi:zinc-dependent metalloprotease [Zhihengliuella halotolerans]|uniref:zinc-dependent metalloprotease n=1 Tax=Zhihengliuella halotolerans TaxID=370736 RepID=UPI000C809036|nr:zinc-dependent metalloprotease [Zhihengliuella halotolerans]